MRRFRILLDQKVSLHEETDFWKMWDVLNEQSDYNFFYFLNFSLYLSKLYVKYKEIVKVYTLTFLFNATLYRILLVVVTLCYLFHIYILETVLHFGKYSYFHVYRFLASLLLAFVCWIQSWDQQLVSSV